MVVHTRRHLARPGHLLRHVHKVSRHHRPPTAHSLTPLARTGRYNADRTARILLTTRLKGPTVTVSTRVSAVATTGQDAQRSPTTALFLVSVRTYPQHDRRAKNVFRTKYRSRQMLLQTVNRNVLLEQRSTNGLYALRWGNTHEQRHLPKTGKCVIDDQAE